jgi:hypothetical protein
MADLPLPTRRRLRQLAHRLALGLFLDIWPRWAAAALLAAGVTALGCRILVPAASRFLSWLWIAPALAIVPAAILCRLRAFTPGDVVAVADSLAGGNGTLLAVQETRDGAWTESPLLARASAYRLPRIHPWRALRPAAAAAVFLAAALAMPQRAVRASNTAIADDLAKRLQATTAELKRQQMVTPEEEKALDEAIERIRRAAEQRVDASSWEAADALREKLAADVGEKQRAVKWAEDSLARYMAAAAGGGAPGSEAQAAELSKALEQLAKSGLLAGAPEELRAMLKSGKLPSDAASLRELSASLSKYLKETNGRIVDVAKLGKEFGRFNADDFPLDQSGSPVDGDGEPGRGGVNRGRGDAELTWGKETALFDRFKATPLPPGAARSPDDWAPVVELPGAPQGSPELSASAGARDYCAAAGQGAWRRALAPRHQSAVKKYFAK